MKDLRDLNDLTIHDVQPRRDEVLGSSSARDLMHSTNDVMNAKNDNHAEGGAGAGPDGAVLRRSSIVTPAHRGSGFR